MPSVRLSLIWAGLAAITGAAVIVNPAQVQKLHQRQGVTSLIKLQGGQITLTSTEEEPSILILDYGVETEGISSFEVVSTSGDTSVLEITYSETKAALSLYLADGPLPLAAAMDTYRVNRYNVSGPGQFTNRLIQGGFRYQKLNLSSPGVLTLQNVGVRPTVITHALNELPGSFECSDDVMTDIWTVGARTVQLSEIPKNSVPEFWEVTDEGAVVESLAPQANRGLVAVTSTAYSLDFKVKPVVGGFGFTVLSDTLNLGIYMSVDVAARTIVAYIGSTTFDTELARATIPENASLVLNSWYSVHVDVSLAGISVKINDHLVISFTQTQRFFGSYGLGASFGHKAIFRDLVVKDASTGTVTYEHPLTNKGFLNDFGLGTNPFSVSVDGSRRDRIPYAGDLDVAGAAALTSTHGLEFIQGTLDLLGSFQLAPGFFAPTAKMQQPPLETPLNVNQTGLIGYSWNLLTAVAQTYMHTGDVGFARKWAPKVVKMLDWSHSQLLPNGLLNISDPSIGGDWNYYDPAQSGIITKFNVLYAYALQETATLLVDAGVDISIYQDRLAKLRSAIDNQLWSDELGAYVYSENIRDGFAQDSNAIAILAGVNLNPAHSSQAILANMAKILNTPHGSGPLAFSPGVVSRLGFKKYISPYASSYHLRAALTIRNQNITKSLLNSIWAPMANRQNQNFTGCFWETLDEFGRPAFGPSTSLCHGWSAGPTAELSRFVLGARPTRPGWAEWIVAPQTLGLQYAKGQVPTPRGPVVVSWELIGDLVTMSVEAPVGTTGNITLPVPLPVAAADSVITLDGIPVEGTSFSVLGGKKVVLVQSRK